jgi:hypothetical protein
MDRDLLAAANGGESCLTKLFVAVERAACRLEPVRHGKMFFPDPRCDSEMPNVVIQDVVINEVAEIPYMAFEWRTVSVLTAEQLEQEVLVKLAVLLWIVIQKLKQPAGV